MTDNSEKLLWVDVETTGLKPDDSLLLQVAALVTDTQGNELSDPFERVVYHSDPEAARDSAVAFVQEMHDATGLWDRLPQGDPLEKVDTDLLSYIKTVAPNPRQARLAGSSIRLDLNFSEFYLPKTYSHLHYRSVDVSALAYVVDEWTSVGYFEKKKTHDAVDDIRESLEEFRWIRSHILK